MAQKALSKSAWRMERLYKKQHGCDFLSNLALKAVFPSKHFTLQFKHITKPCAKKNVNHVYCLCIFWDIFTKNILLILYFLLNS